MIRQRHFSTIAAGFLALTLSSGSAFAQSEGGLAQSDGATPSAVFRGICVTILVDFAVADNSGLSTTSMTFVDMPDMVINWSQIVGSCVKVQFSAYSYAPSDRLLYVRALIDGVIAPPGEVQFSGDDDEDNDGRWARSHAFDFILPNVPAGNHQVKIQWRSSDGGQVFVHKRSLMIHRY